MMKDVESWSEKQLLILVYNLLCSFKYLHALGLIHRDVTPSNLLMNTDCTVKVCDFGWARTVEKIKSKTKEKSEGVEASKL